MDTPLVIAVHALVGSIVVGSGVLALSLRKGSAQHTLAGRLFVGSMLLMGPVVAAGALSTPGSLSSLGILFVFFIIYLVISAWSTIRQTELPITRLDIAAPAAALCISIAGLVMGFDTINNPSDVADLPPNQAYFFFAALAFVAMLLDANNLRLGGVRGKHRIVRHVWRMACALFFATSTLFTGPGSIVFPESVRGNLAMSIPQILVALLALIWIYRLLSSKRRHFPANVNAVLELHDPTNSRTKSHQS